MAEQNKFSISKVIKELKAAASFRFNSSYNRKKAALNAEWLQELLSYKDEDPITTGWLKKYFQFYQSEDDGDVWIQKEILKKHCIYIYEMAEYRWQVHVETDERREDIDQQLDMLKKQWKAVGGNIVTVTLDVEDDYVDYDEAIKRTHYQWDGKQIKKIKEFDCSKE